MPPTIFILALAAVVVGTQGTAFTGLLEDLARDLNVSVAVAGQLVTAFAITSAVASPLVVSLLARFDRKAILLCALASVGFINLGTAALPSFEGFLAARVLVAIVGGAVMPMAGAIAASLVSPEKRGQALGIVLSGLTIAFILGVPLGTAVGGVFGWRATFVFSGLIALAVVPVIAWKVPGTSADEVRAPADWGVLQKPVVPYSLVLMFLSFVGAYPILAFVGPLVTALSGVEGAAIGAMQSAIGIGSLAGVIIGAKMADARVFTANMAAMFTALMLVLSIWIVLTAASPSGILAIGLTFIALLLTAAALMAPSPSIEKALVEADPAQSSLTLAVNTSVLYAGQGIGTAIGGVVLGTSGFFGLSVFATSVLGAGLLFAVLGARRPQAA